MDELLCQFERYAPQNEQEARDREEMLRALRCEPDVLTRENKRLHFTASAWLTNKTRTRIVMVWHNIFRSWSWCGGHADGCADLAAVALREAKEETGLDAVLTDKRIFSLETLTVDGHEKNGLYVPSHLHLNVTFHLTADEDAPLFVKPDENSGVRWFSPEEAVAACTEPWVAERIYKKLNARL